MKRRVLSAVLVAVLLSALLAGCRDSMRSEPVDGTTVPTTTTTTTTTTATTTENLKTTFPESETRKIYPGLVKDPDGTYSYKLAEFETYYDGSNETRTANLKAAAHKIDDIVIPDGQVFSFNQTVGKRTVTAGYSEAKIIRDGEFVDGLGGGVCQVSSTVFRCVLLANVEIVARANHSLEVSYVRLGGDATVQWNSCDFQFKNNLGCDMKLKMSCSGGVLTCEAYGKKDVRPGDVDVSITKNGDTYTLTRTVNGKTNYTTQSKYAKPKPSTTKPPATTAAAAAKPQKTKAPKTKAAKKKTTEKKTTKKKAAKKKAADDEE